MMSLYGCSTQKFSYKLGISQVNISQLFCKRTCGIRPACGIINLRTSTIVNGEISKGTNKSTGEKKTTQSKKASIKQKKSSQTQAKNIIVNDEGSKRKDKSTGKKKTVQGKKDNKNQKKDVQLQANNKYPGTVYDQKYSLYSQYLNQESNDELLAQVLLQYKVVKQILNNDYSGSLEDEEKIRKNFKGVFEDLKRSKQRNRLLLKSAQSGVAEDVIFGKDFLLDSQFMSQTKTEAEQTSPFDETKAEAEQSFPVDQKVGKLNVYEKLSTSDGDSAAAAAAAAAALDNSVEFEYNTEAKNDPKDLGFDTDWYGTSSEISGDDAAVSGQLESSLCEDDEDEDVDIDSGVIEDVPYGGEKQFFYWNFNHSEDEYIYDRTKYLNSNKLDEFRVEIDNMDGDDVQVWEINFKPEEQQQ